MENLEELNDLFESDFRGFTEHEFGPNTEKLDRRCSFEQFLEAMKKDQTVNPSLPPPDASWKEILEETNWDLLREQKKILSEILTEYHKKGMKKRADENTIKRFSAIEGILDLLNHIQDAAANDIGEEKVFNYRCDKCDGQLKTFMKPDDSGKGVSETFGCPKCDS